MATAGGADEGEEVAHEENSMSVTILIADDSRMMRTMVRAALEADHHQVVEAPDGRAALALASAAAPPADLVITDINMPEMDGLALVRALRERPDYRFTPILVLTTERGEDMKQKGREAGATGWLVKPFDAGRLREAVDHVLRRKSA
jgi:two-component system chemotaxis response regulator CheY